MSRIIGDPNLIQAARSAPPADKSVYINWDAIAELPDEYEVVISEVKYNPQDLASSFSDVGGGNWMPTPEMHYKIAEAKGISGGDSSIVEPIYEEVNYSDMTMDPLPQMLRMVVGYRCKKWSRVLEEDGSERRSSVCEIQYNVWNRCQELWAKEELESQGYTNQPPQRGWKYDSKYKRRAHFQREIKFAQPKAETKAHEKTIRELAGLMTGYKQKDLYSGSLVFAKVRRSRESLKMESAAKLTAMSQGLTIGQDGGAAGLFGTQNEPVEPQDAGPLEPDKTVSPPPSKDDRTRREIAKATFSFYKNEKLVAQDQAAIVDNILAWFDSPEYNDGDKETWDKAIYWLKEIEKNLDPSQKMEHRLW